MTLLSTTTAAKLLGVTQRMVRMYIDGGKLEARRYGREWLITEREVKRLKRERTGSKRGPK